MTTLGGIYTLGRHNNFKYNHQKTCLIVAVYVILNFFYLENIIILNLLNLFRLDGFTGILAGFAIFSGK